MKIISHPSPPECPAQPPALSSARGRQRGTALQAEWLDCRHAADGLRHADTLKSLCLRICGELQLRVVGNAFFQFEPSGVTGTILLNDSHIAIHTWPESSALKADIYLPNSNSDALQLFEKLKPHFQPGYSNICRSGHQRS
jgi:S-adenosylmethionine/arginine decarboxylase-like enzyme